MAPVANFTSQTDPQNYTTFYPFQLKAVLGKKLPLADSASCDGWRGDTSIVKRIESDIFYLENWSIWLDLKILWMTMFGRDTNKNAY